MKINLYRSYFSEAERTIAEWGEFKAFAFRYSSGIEALRIENLKGGFVLLPFHGQQLWKMNFGGREISMKTTIKEPVPTKEYLKNYGGFLYHCGICAFGNPDEIHPLHGELPNANYDSAYIEFGEDSGGKYIAVGGEYNYDVAFTRKYRFSPKCILYSGASVLNIRVCLENLRSDPMEYMYLCHINFLPLDGARLIYSARRGTGNVKVYKTVEDGTPPDKVERLLEFMDKAENDPSLHEAMGTDGEFYDPEICFGLKYIGDENGRAYTLQYKPGWGSCYVSHPVDVLPYVIRWIARTDEEDAIGMALPATAEHLGYGYAKKNGQVKYLPPHSKLEFCIEAGYISEPETEEVKAKIAAITGAAND